MVLSLFDKRNETYKVAFKKKLTTDNRSAFQVCHVLSYLSRLINAIAFTV